MQMRFSGLDGPTFTGLPNRMVRAGAVLAVIAWTVTAASQARATIDDAIACWYFEGTLLDSCGSNDGTGYNDPDDPEFVAGKSGEALRLDGDGDYVDAGNAYLIPADFTVAMFVNLPDVTADYRYVLTQHKEHDNSAGGWYLGINDEGALVFGHFSTGSGTTVFASDTTPITTGETWYHIAMTFDDAINQYTMYVDGGDVGQGTQDVNVLDSGQPILMGAIEWSGGSIGDFSRLDLDEVRIYDRVLDSTEIAVLAAIPEPTTAVLLGFGLAGLAVAGRRRSRH
jgi:hypothetical protein